MGEAEIIVPQTAKDPEALSAIMESICTAYALAVDHGESLEDSAYTLPLGIETTFLLAGNLRVFYEYFQKRLCKRHVQDEHYRMAMKMWGMLCELYPIMRNAHPCKACGECE